MELYRIAQEQYATDLSGNGARIYGGRWNSEGFAALYTASSRALALLETLAHIPAGLLREKNYLLVHLHLPDNVGLRPVETDSLPAGWDAPDIPPQTRKIGDDFLAGSKHLLLAVPSVLIYEEKNFVLNPRHPDMKKLRIVHSRRIRFDKRVGGHL